MPGPRSATHNSTWSPTRCAGDIDRAAVRTVVAGVLDADSAARPAAWPDRRAPWPLGIDRRPGPAALALARERRLQIVLDGGDDGAARRTGARSSVSCPASRRARRSRSRTSRSIRSECRAMTSRNSRERRRVGRRVEQRFDVAANRRERRAQLVRDVGDEVAAHLVGVPQVGDVVQHENRAAAALAAHRHDVGHESAAAPGRARPRRARRRLAAERGRDEREAMSGWRTTSR